MKETILKLRPEGALYFAGFCTTIPLANWMISNIGTFCIPDGLCLIPVAPGLMATSGVVAVGAALVLRDLVQRRLGLIWAMLAVVIGAVMSGLVAPPALAFASIAAFALSELADMAIFTPLQRRGLVLAVAASSVVGLAVDSAVFLFLAFGNLDFLLGQIVGKSWAVLVALPLLHLLRRRGPPRTAAAV